MIKGKRAWNRCTGASLRFWGGKSAVRRSWRAKRWMKGSRDEQLNVPVGASRGDELELL